MEGRGAFLRVAGSPDTPIRCAAFYEADAGLILVGSASHNTAATQEFVSGYISPSFAQLGSSLKLLLVAEGQAHIYPRMAPTCEWDTAAAHVIVTEAGGEVLCAGECDSQGVLLPGVDWRSALAQQQPVRYNKPNQLNPFFVVYGRRVKA